MSKADLGLAPGSVALITGAGSGMGRETALAFAGAGCKLGLLDRNKEGLDETVKLLGLPEDQFLVLVVDILDDAKARQAVKDVGAKFGRLDYALNVAGVVGGPAGLEESHMADYDFTMNINMRAQYVLAQEEIRLMLDQEPLPSVIAGLDVPEAEKTRRTKHAKLAQGSIVMWGVTPLFPFFVDESKREGVVSDAFLDITQSWSSQHTVPSVGYTTSKHAVWGLTRVLACSYASKGIRINCLAPGIVDTPLLPVGGLKAMEVFLDGPTVPQQRICDPAEVADVALYLCSERSSYVNGTLLCVDGAWNSQ